MALDHAAARPMDKDTLERAFTRLGEHLRRDRVAADISIFGGAAIVLAFEFRQATRDVDTIVSGGEHGAVLRAQQEVARELNLPPNWLNEQAAAYLSKVRDFRYYRAYPSETNPTLRVYVASPKYLLAMKLLAMRAGTKDFDDALLLSRHTRIRSARGLVDLIKRYYPDAVPSPHVRDRIDELVKTIHASRQPQGGGGSGPRRR